MADVRRVDFPPRTARKAWNAARYWFAGFLVVAACVMSGLATAVDERIFELARPGDVWGSGQVRWALVVDAASPAVAAALLAVVAITVGLLNRTVRPAVVTAAAAAVAAVATLLVKLLLARPDPHSTGTGHGGSFPSGHTVGVVVCVGLAVHLLVPGARRWAEVAAGAAGAVMGLGLVVIGAHWATDGLGGLLLGLGVLVAATTGRGRPAEPGLRRLAGQGEVGELEGRRRAVGAHDLDAEADLAERGVRRNPAPAHQIVDHGLEVE